MTTPTLRLLQISDLHLVEDDKLLRNVMDTSTRMREALDKLLVLEPAAIIISGDVGQRHHYVHDDAAAYFGHFQEELDIPFITVAGNHDPIDSIGATFNPARLASGPELCDTVHDISGLRIIGLDSHGVGSHFGRLTEKQYDWLAAQLAEPAEHGTLLVMHHPPIPATTVSQRGSGLHHPEKLLEVIAETDVRGILSGHYHHQVSGMLGHIPVWVSGAASYNFDLLSEDTMLRGMDDGWATVVDIYPHTVTFSSVLLTQRHPVFAKRVG